MTLTNGTMQVRWQPVQSPVAMAHRVMEHLNMAFGVCVMVASSMRECWTVDNPTDEMPASLRG
jgi:hypothetical protein